MPNVVQDQEEGEAANEREKERGGWKRREERRENGEKELKQAEIDPPISFSNSVSPGVFVGEVILSSIQRSPKFVNMGWSGTLLLVVMAAVQRSQSRIQPEIKPPFGGSDPGRPDKGRALGPKVDGRLSLHLLAGSETDPVPGQPLSLWIKVAGDDRGRAVKTCTWRSPLGTDHKVDPGPVSTKGNLAPG